MYKMARRKNRTHRRVSRNRKKSRIKKRSSYKRNKSTRKLRSKKRNRRISKNKTRYGGSRMRGGSNNADAPAAGAGGAAADAATAAAARVAQRDVLVGNCQAQQGRLDEILQHIGTVKGRVQAKNAEIQRLQEQLQAAMTNAATDSEESEAAQAAIQSQLDTSRADLAEMRTARDALQAGLDQAQQDMTDLLGGLRDIPGLNVPAPPGATPPRNGSDIISRIQALIADLGRANDELGTVRQAAADAQAAADTARLAAADQAATDAREVAAQAAVDQAEAVDQAVAGARQDAEETARQVAEAHERDLQAAAAEAEAEVARSEVIIEDLRGNLERVGAELAGAMGNVDTRDRRVLEFVTECKERIIRLAGIAGVDPPQPDTDVAAELFRRILALEDAISDKLQAMQERMDASEHTVTDLTQQLTQAQQQGRAAAGTAEATVTQLRAALEECERVKRGLESQYAELQQQFGECNGAIGGKLATLNDEIQGLLVISAADPAAAAAAAVPV